MNRMLAEFLVADGRPEKTKNYPALNGFLYAVACSPEVIDEAKWLPMIFDGKKVNYKNEKQRQAIEQGLLDEFAQIEKKMQSRAPVLADYFRPSSELMENFDEDSPIAHWGAGFASGHDWLEQIWLAYVAEDQYKDLTTCVDLLTFFSDKPKAQKLCEAQGIEKLDLAVYAESVLDNFDAAAQGYAHFGLSIRAAIEAHVHEPDLRDCW